MLLRPDQARFNPWRPAKRPDELMYAAMGMETRTSQKAHGPASMEDAALWAQQGTPPPRSEEEEPTPESCLCPPHAHVVCIHTRTFTHTYTVKGNQEHLYTQELEVKRLTYEIVSVPLGFFSMYIFHLFQHLAFNLINF